MRMNSASLPITSFARLGRRASTVALLSLVVLFGALGSSHAGPAAAAPTESSPVTVTLEFDDGGSDQLQAASILDAHGMHGVFFLNSGRLGLPGYMTVAEAQGLAADGHEIGGHTVSHADLPTLGLDEQIRQVCNDRVSLLNEGFQVYDFAYPFGDYAAGTESVVEGCGYNSARSIGGVASPGSCSGCPGAETLPPQDDYALITPDSIKSSTTMQDLEGFVTQAEQQGGGWVQLVMHHVCAGSGCDTLSVAPSTLSSFLDWLQARGTPVKTTHQVIGGALAPPVNGPPPPFNDGVLQNGSLESPSSRSGSTVPDCWSLGGAGTTTATGTSTSDAHSGSWAYRIDLSAFSSGADKKIYSRQDLGACAPGASPGEVYQLSAWYKTNAQSRFVAYYRNGSGGWTWWAQQASNLPTASSSYRQATWTLPAIPAGATAISVAMSIRSVGFVTVDDFALVNTADDTTPPTVQITSPTDGATVTGTVPVKATASDNLGVTKVEFYADGQLIGTATSAPFQINWNTATASKPNLGLTAKAYDTAGNVAVSQGVNVTIQQSDTSPPSVSLTAPGDGAGVSGVVSLVAGASDDVGVVRVEFYRGSSLVGSVSSSPYQVSWDTTSVVNGSYSLSAKAFDAAGNSAVSAAVSVTVSNALSNLLVNSSLETATSNVPDCWQLGSSGSNTATWAWTTDAHTGSRAEQVQISSYTSGDRKLVVKQDSGVCAPAVSAGAKYALGAYYKSSTAARFIVFYRNASGSWVYWTESPVFAASASWAQASWTTPVVPAGATRISFGLGITAVGSLTQDDLSLGAPDTTPPTVALTAPSDGATVSGANVTVSAGASDNVGVAKVELYRGASLIGSVTSSPYQVSWDTTAVANGSYGLTAKAYDAAANTATSTAVTVTVSNTASDTTPPVTTISCGGSTCQSGYYTGPVAVGLSASDSGSGVSITRYTTDGSTPSATTGLIYGGPFTLAQTTTVKFLSVDQAGNVEQVRSQSVLIRTASPNTTVSIQFDDGLLDQYQAISLLAKYSFHGTFFINSAEVGTASDYYMNWTQVHAVASAGNEIGGHTLHHPDLITISAAAAQTEICDDRTALVNQGFSVTNFAYPYGHTNATVANIVRNCGYGSGRGVTGLSDSGPYAETLPPADSYLTRTPENPDNTTTLAQLQSYVTRAEQHGGGWVQIVFHHLCDPASSGCTDEYSTSPQIFEGLLSWLHDRGSVVKTTSEALGPINPTDTTPPTVALTAPSDGATVSGANVTVSAGASDNVGVAKVELYRGASLIGSVTSSPYQVSWDTTAVANGSYGLTAKAYDAAGNTATSTAVTVTVSNTASDTSPPSVSLTAPGDGAGVSGVVSLVAGASDDVGVVRVEFYRGSSLVGSVSSSPYQVSWDTTSVVNGSYSLSAKAFDAAGNSAVSAAVSVTVSNALSNLLVNSSLETATSNVPDCWQLGSSGSNTATWAWTTDAHTGSRAEQVQISSYTSGDRKLVVKQDSGVCAPAVSAGAKYALGAYYKSSTAARFIVFYRNASGSWVYWTESPVFAASASWAQASWTTPVVPAGATRISFGLGITAVGSLTQDDLSLAGAG